MSQSLFDSFAYLDDITICGHDRNLENFKAAAKQKNLTYNNDKCKFSTRPFIILGSVESEGEI